MTHSRIEIDVMVAMERTMNTDIPALVIALNRQVEAQERVATQLENLMSFLHGTTIEQVETKRKDMKSKNRKIQTTSKTEQEVSVLKDFVEKHTTKGE